MSMHDLGGRAKWARYSLASGGSSGAGSSSAAAGSSSRPGASSNTNVGTGGSNSGYTVPKYQGGYMPARSPSPSLQHEQTQDHPSSAQPQAQLQPIQQHLPQTPAQDHSTNYTHPDTSRVSTDNVSSLSTAITVAATSQAEASAIVTRVKALHRFQPTEPGELAFEKGDIIKVVDRDYKDWWRGQLKGRTGIFPVNYVVSFCIRVSDHFRVANNVIRNQCLNQPRLNLPTKLNKKQQCLRRLCMLRSCCTSSGPLILPKTT